MTAMQRVDVLIVTAIREEYAAVRAVDTGALAGSTWEARTAPTGLEIRVRPFVAAGGGQLWVAVTQALGMGGVEAVSACAQLVAAYQIRCLAMCGVCAGRRGEVALGDVIIADRMWTYDTGKRKVEVDDAGETVETDRGDLEMYRIAPPSWKQKAERFMVDPAAEWPATRPRTYAAQGDWVLERVLHGIDPGTDAESKTKCADFEKVLARLWKKKLLRDGKLTLTAAGKKHIERVLLQNRGELPQPPAFRTHVGPMASGSRVTEDAEIFERLSTGVRKVLGLEMEAAAIGGLAWARGVEHVVVMKGVMDHADPEKCDNFKGFAARASAECLIQFVREHLPVVGDAEDPILVRETSPLPEKFGAAALLNARHHVVDFVGREALLGGLQEWCEREGRVDAKLIHAAGGMGKTRLAMELCKRMRAARWRVGFVSKGLGVDRFATLLQSDEPVLAVIDYAEGRGQLRELLEAAAVRRGEKGKKKLRVVLLARNADEWWTDLRRSDGAVKDLLSDEPVALRAVETDREAVFRVAVKAFAKRRDKKVPTGATPSLTNARYERVLYVHMAALALVEGREAEADRLMEDTLDHEERFWREQLHDRVAVDDVRRTVAAVTLTGGVGSAAEVLAVVELICGAPDKKMVQLLHDLYPGSTAHYVSGLEPDLLGEVLVWRVLSKEGNGAGSYLDLVFEGATDRAIRTGFSVLGRLSEDHKEADSWIAHVLGRDVAGRAMDAFAAAKSMGERTAHSRLGPVLAKALERAGTVEIAKRLEAELPNPERTVSLREVGRWVLETRLKHLRPEGTDEERARLLNNLSLYQGALNQREAALTSTLEAVVLYGRLAEAQPDAFRPDVAMGFHNLGIMQSALGQRQEALGSAREAVGLYRRLAEARENAFLPGLAASLNNLGKMQRELGQREAALASTLEAVRLYRRLAEARPDTFLPTLAMSFNNLGNMQSDLGQQEPALASALEAVSLYRRLAEVRPDAFLPSLATSLSNLGMMQRALGQREVALASAQEAVALYRRLGEAQSDAFLPDLAMSLNNLGMMQSALGQRDAALASALEAVALYRRLADERPGAFLPVLAASLLNLGMMQSALGAREAALAWTLEAVTLYRRLAGSHPELFRSDLAKSLTNLGVMRSKLGEHEAALASTQEAVAILRERAESHPEPFRPDLAKSLNSLALRLRDLGRIAEALPFAEEALDLLWPLYESSPAAHGNLAISVLGTTADLLKALGQAPGKRWTQRMTRYLASSGS
jgi:tetratricopeptide (TPR) repeat protein/nucleoside phosphorylase